MADFANGECICSGESCSDEMWWFVTMACPKSSVAVEKLARRDRAENSLR